MATRFKPHEYQREAIDFLVGRLVVEDAKGGGLFLDPGLGKTGITLSVLEVLRAQGLAHRTLIIAPLRAVYKVWPDEIKKWGFQVEAVIVHGSATTRRGALAKRADLYLINPEGVDWLEKEYRLPRFDVVVCDESTLFKTWSAKRTKALRRLCRKIPKRIILTGTPSPNGLGDLYSQLFIVDDGEALGKNITQFREWAMRDVGRGNRSKWEVTPAAEPLIHEKIRDKVLYMKAEDHLDMPALVNNVVWVDLPPAVRAAYRKLEKDLFAELENGSTLIASTAAAKYGLCRGLANGGGYERRDHGDRATVHVHEEKVAAVEEIVDELAGKPALVAYLYNHDRDRLLRRFPGAPVICGDTSGKRTGEIIDEWNARAHRVVLVQPQALAHGANMQAGGNDLIWCGVPDSLELYQQLVRRLYRQGVMGQVRVHHILAADTIDVAVWDRLESKDETQSALLSALKRYREGKKQ